MGLPALVLLMLIMVVIFDLLVRHTRFFRQVYFIGANEKAAMLSGIHVSRVRIIAYILSGALAALAGVLLASRLMSGTPTAGNGIELQVLAAAVIGGASLQGGEGTVLGAFLGVVFVALINNSMTMLAVSIYWQMIARYGFSSRRSTRYVDPSSESITIIYQMFIEREVKMTKLNRRNLQQQEPG